LDFYNLDALIVGTCVLYWNRQWVGRNEINPFEQVNAGLCDL